MWLFNIVKAIFTLLLIKIKLTVIINYIYIIYYYYIKYNINIVIIHSCVAKQLSHILFILCNWVKLAWIVINHKGIFTKKSYLECVWLMRDLMQWLGM